MSAVSRRVTLLCLALVTLARSAPTQRPPDATARIAAIDHLQPEAISYHRNAEDIDALAADWTTEQVRALLRDADSKTRAIALVLLHEQLGPRALQDVLPHLDDQAPAPPAHDPFSRGPLLPGLPAPKPAERPQTVGNIACAILGQYLPQQIVTVRVDRENTNYTASLLAAYSEYARTRRDRPHCLVWLKVAAQRAGGGIDPTPAERLPEIRDLRRQVDAIPAPERHWYLLVLANELRQPGREAFATERDLLDAARALGPDALLSVLRGLGPADLPAKDKAIDPDLTAARSSPFGWEGISRFVLRHGAALIPRERCAEWLDLERLHVEKRSGGLGPDRASYGIESADWRIVAADLQPERAREHLDAGLASLSDDYLRGERGRLALAGVTRLGAEGLVRAVAWFYGEPPERGFVMALARPEHARLLWAIAADPRLDVLPWGAIPELARAGNAHLVAAERFSEEALNHSLQHPLGIACESFHAGGPTARAGSLSIAAARAKHPDATRQLEEQIAAIRTRLREIATQKGR